jgi:hypothetical protein
MPLQNAELRRVNFELRRDLKRTEVPTRTHARGAENSAAALPLESDKQSVAGCDEDDAASDDEDDDDSDGSGSDGRSA